MKYIIFGSSMKKTFTIDELDELGHSHFGAINFANVVNLNNYLENNYTPLKYKFRCKTCESEITDSMFIILIGKNEACYLENKVWCDRNLGTHCVANPDPTNANVLVKFKKLVFVYSHAIDYLPNIKSNWKQILCFGREGVILTGLTEGV